MILTIDQEFARLIPALLPEEFKQLEANILQDGEIKEPLSYWKCDGKNMLLDGHNRLRIAEKHGTKYSTTEIVLADRDYAKLWILLHQLGRRNLQPGVRNALVSDTARLAEQIKAKASAIKAAAASKLATETKQLEKKGLTRVDAAVILTAASKSVSVTKSNTYEDYAKKAGVPINQIRQFRAIESKAPEVANMIRKGSLEQRDAAKLAALPALARELAVKTVTTSIKSGEAPDVRSAIRAAKKDDYNAAVATAKPKRLEGTYRILYADPPWKYNDNGMDEYGHAERHYNCLTIEQLRSFQVNDRRVEQIADKDSVLFLWVTSPLLPEAFSIIRAWGFEYKSSFVWDKIAHNMGHYNSMRHEFLLICTRGRCLPDSSKLVDSVQSIERSSKHSQKPEEFRKIIESMYDHGRKLELFWRGEKAPDGWDTYGNE